MSMVRGRKNLDDDAEQAVAAEGEGEELAVRLLLARARADVLLTVGRDEQQGDNALGEGVVGCYAVGVDTE